MKTLDNLLLFADAYCLGIQDLLGNLIPWWFQRTQLFHTAVVRRLFFLGSLLLIPLWDVLPLGCPGSSVISEDHSCLRTAQWYGGFSFEEVCSVPASGRCVCLDGVTRPFGYPGSSVVSEDHVCGMAALLSRESALLPLSSPLSSCIGQMRIASTALHDHDCLRPDKCGGPPRFHPHKVYRPGQ